MTAEPYTREQVADYKVAYLRKPDGPLTWLVLRLIATIEALDERLLEARASLTQVRLERDAGMEEALRIIEHDRATIAAKDAEIAAYKALQRHQQAIIMGKDAADAARSVIAGHEETRQQWARHWEKLDDELCPACAQANTILRLDAENARLRDWLAAFGWEDAALARGDAAVEAKE